MGDDVGWWWWCVARSSARVFLFVECFYWFTGGENRLLLYLFAVRWMDGWNGKDEKDMFCLVVVVLRARRKNNEIFSVYINFHFLLWRIYLLWWMVMAADSLLSFVTVFLSVFVIVWK